MALPYPHLFQPIRLGAKEARNRIMRLATTTNTGKDGQPTERTVAFYGRVARGGSGVVVTESMRVHASNAGRDHAMLLFEDAIVPGLARVAEAVRGEGALFIVQINHGGRQHHANEIPTLWAPSALACPHSGGVPHEMSKPEIASVVAGFAHAALNAQRAGADGVEIHGAQGHLIQAFCSPFSNRRTDEYGGTAANRLRFAREVIAAVREKTGGAFVVGYRLGVEEFASGGIGIEDSKEIASELAGSGLVDYLSLAQGTFNTLDTHLPDAHYPPLCFAGLHAEIRAVARGVPVVASSRIQTPEQAESLIAEGRADMAGLCRALIADPEWPAKAREGRSEDIVRCISTSQCWGWIVGTKRLSCSINPTVGYEQELPPLVRAAEPRRIAVIGGGPAGLEAARVAAECGHRVVLFEREHTLGGKLRNAARFAPFHEAHLAIEHLARQVEKSGTALKLGVSATAREIAAGKPDAVIVATGADIACPALPGDGSVPVLAFGAEIPDLPPGAIVVMDEDGYYWAAAVTEALARAGRAVTYVTRFLEPLREVPEVSRISTLRALDELGVTCLDNMYVARAEKGAAVLRHYYNPKREATIAKVGAVVWLGVQRANGGLAAELHALGIDEVKVVGDAYMPRRLAQAIAEGHRAGRACSQAPARVSS